MDGNNCSKSLLSHFLNCPRHCLISTTLFITITTFSMSPNSFHHPPCQSSIFPISFFCQIHFITKWSVSSTSPFPHSLHILSSLLSPCHHSQYTPSCCCMDCVGVVRNSLDAQVEIYTIIEPHINDLYDTGCYYMYFCSPRG